MGNNHSSNQHKHVMMIKHEDVIIHRNFNMQLELGSLDTFPHGLDGLRIWEAGIVLARYVINNSHLFKGKRVLELGGGVGIAGLTAKKWTECIEVDITDYPPSVIQNIMKNMTRNKLSCPVYELDWTKHDSCPSQYQIIMGSDIVYFGCPVADLYQVLKERLMPGGLALIVIPIRKNYAELFLSKIEKSVFELEIEKLEKEQYF